MTQRLEPASPSISASLARADRLQRRVTVLDRRIDKQSARQRWHQSARLSVAGLFFVGLLIGTLKPEWKIELPLFVVFVIVFGALVIRTSRIRRFVDGLKALRAFNERQRLRLLGQPSGRGWETVRELLEKESITLARDLGTVGTHSLFTLIDETLTDQGERRLIEWMRPHSRPVAEILARQKQIQSLRGESWFYTRLTLIANAEEFRVSSSQILEFLKHEFVGRGFKTLLGFVLLAWVLMIAGVAAYSTSGWGHPGFFIAGFAALNLWALGRVGSMFKKGVGLELHLSLLAPIFKRLEARASHRAHLRALVPTTAAAGPSREAKKLSRTLGILGIETNPLLYLLINAVLPWTMIGNFLLEKRRAALAANFPKCLAELAELEVIGSILILDRYQTKAYPRFLESPHLEFKAAFHPLIPRAQVVANDFAFTAGKTLGLLTGSNMAGKSTFLRTVGLNQLLAQMGAPVFAEDYVTSTFDIETCIEVSDSLRDGFSYFYAEVRRLRDLIRASDTGRPVLYLIDEIFRGTNNRERHIGSRAVIRHLAKHSASLGFISTHDLELVVLDQTEPRLLNLHFREDFEAGRMVFHYRLRLGPCPTTNALKIMQAEGIAVDEA